MRIITEDERVEHEREKFEKRQNLRRLWHLFWLLAKPFFFYAPGAKFNFLWVIFLILLRSSFVVVFSFLSRDFWTALQQKNEEVFWRLIRLFTLVLLCALPTLVWCDYAQARLALRWRRWLTEKVITDYFSHRNFYQIDQQGSNAIDNPDQRISQDVDAFTTTSLSFFYKVTRALIDLFNFSVILFSIYPSLFLILVIYSAFGTTTAVILGKRLINLNFKQLKLEADFRYALIRVRENAESIAFYKGERREKAETARRFHFAFLNQIDLLVWSRNLRFFTESYTYLVEVLPLAVIAPLYFKNIVQMGVVSQASQAFRHILSDLSIIVDEFDRLSSFSAGVDRLGELEQFMYDRFLKGNGNTDGDEDSNEQHSEMKKRHQPENEIDDSVAATLFGRQYTLDIFRSLYKRHILRSDELNPLGSRSRNRSRSRMHNEDSTPGGQSFTIDDEGGDDDDDDDNDTMMNDAEDGFLTSEIKTIIHETPEDEGAHVEVKDLTLATPDIRQRVLFECVSFTLSPGSSLLIAGPSGTGKSSLLRAIAGLWTSGHGTIQRPSLSQMFFLPQKPYCTLGTLRHQLVYPRTLSQASHISDNDLLNALTAVNLSELPSRMGGLDTTYDWANVLSLGEQQRLAFARLLIGRPKLAILDECSSALDVATEQKLYAKLRDLDVSFISVGHRPSLLHYHEYILRLGGRLGRSYVFERVEDPSNQEM